MVTNPPWVTQVLEAEAPRIARIHPGWIPRRSDDGELVEYGCGHFGCVLPTIDPSVVIKVTTDDTEAEFAGAMAATLVRPICVRYYATMETEIKHEGQIVTLLWRESAELVGELHEHLWANDRPDDIRVAYDMLDDLHVTGRAAFEAMRVGRSPREIELLVVAWLEACEVMARQTRVPELRTLGDGLVEVYGQQHIFLGDLHSGNIGRVERAGTPQWVITDPGRVAVVMAA